MVAARQVTPVQTKVLALRPQEPSTSNLKDPPPTLCMEPFNTGLDMYALGDPSAELQDTIVRRAVFQHGSWVASPSYHRSIPFIFDILTGTIWTRGGTPSVVSGAWDATAIRKDLGKLGDFPADIRWLHCLRVPSRSSVISYCTIVVDYLHNLHPHSFRYSRLVARGIPQLGIKMEPVSDRVFLIPQFPAVTSSDLWAALHVQNADFKREVYNGILARERSSKYIFQKEDAYRASPFWHFHPFESNF